MPSTVVTVNWTDRYHTHPAFLAWFLTEQEYVDAEFIMIVMFNYGVWLDNTELHSAHERGSCLQDRTRRGRG